MEILSAVFAGTIAAVLFILAGIRKIRNIRAGKRGKAARGACRGYPFAAQCRGEASDKEEQNRPRSPRMLLTVPVCSPYGTSRPSPPA